MSNNNRITLSNRLDVAVKLINNLVDLHDKASQTDDCKEKIIYYKKMFNEANHLEIAAGSIAYNIESLKRELGG